ncbi:hypothetical protein [Virgisporangium aurantiacum]|uniref:Uncharacterized protein n=1 Tax=Virgisporangium aurantiacum TaxID=175570 RepID=A0A8J4E3T9_9ACTN|nr:hypothetical protein [Virgisporangium aurantiacum]GIJ61240.1 hypothetical protein Vau01_087560 [Virgisporangium aurantiacum]
MSTGGSFIAVYRDIAGTDTVNRCLHDPGVTATAVHVGGLAGHALTVTRKPDAGDDCAPSLPPGGTKTLYLLTAGTATIIVDVTYVPGPDTADRYRQLTGPVIDSLAFFPPRAPDPPSP